MFQGLAHGATIPIHQWNLDENPITNGMATADTGSTGGLAMTYAFNSGSISSAAGYWGGTDRGAMFSGDTGDMASVNSNATLAYGHQNYTIELYFELDSINTNRRIYSEDNTSGNIFLNIAVNGSKYLDAAINFNDGSWGDAAMSTSLTAGHWYYAAATFTGANGKTPSLYVYDKTAGAVVQSQVTGSSATGSPYTASTYMMTIGNCNSGATGLGGTVSDVAVYNTALDTTTMYQHATQNPVPEPSTLVLLAAGLAGLLCYAWRKRK